MRKHGYLSDLLTWELSQSPTEHAEVQSEDMDEEAAWQLGRFLFNALKTLGKSDGDPNRPPDRYGDRDQYTPPEEQYLDLPLDREGMWRLFVTTPLSNIEADVPRYADEEVRIEMDIWATDKNTVNPEDPYVNMHAVGKERGWSIHVGDKQRRILYPSTVRLTRDIVDAVMLYEELNSITAPPQS